MAERLVCLGLLGLLAAGCQEDVCHEARFTLDVDEQGPAGESPLDTFGFTAGTRVGTLTWGTTGVYEVEVTTTLASTANVVDREHTGPGRLACFDTIEIVATVQIVTPGETLLDDTFTLVLAAEGGVFMTSIESSRDITDHDFEYLGFIPASAPEDLGLDLRLVWMDDAAGTMEGWITMGPDDEIIHFEATAQ